MLRDGSLLGIWDIEPPMKAEDSIVFPVQGRTVGIASFTPSLPPSLLLSDCCRKQMFLGFAPKLVFLACVVGQCDPKCNVLFCCCFFKLKKNKQQKHCIIVNSPLG